MIAVELLTCGSWIGNSATYAFNSSRQIYLHSVAGPPGERDFTPEARRSPTKPPVASVRLTKRCSLRAALCVPCTMVLWTNAFATRDRGYADIRGSLHAVRPWRALAAQYREAEAQGRPQGRAEEGHQRRRRHARRPPARQEARQQAAGHGEGRICIAQKIRALPLRCLAPKPHVVGGTRLGALHPPLEPPRFLCSHALRPGRSG